MMRVIYSSTLHPRARHVAIGSPLKNRQPQPRGSVRSGQRRLVGLTRFELVTPRLSSVCSNQLSYRPPTSPDPVRLASGFVEAGPSAVP
jgi:hypothetical protein